jgi:WD40 repeat protein
LKRICLLILALATWVWPVAAQDDGPYPRITPDNVHMLDEIAMLGQGRFYSVAWSPDGETLAVGGSVGVWLRDPDDLTLPPRLLVDTDEEVASVAYSPAGTRLAAGGDQGEIYVWDVATGEQAFQFDSGSTVVRQIVFSPDGSWLAASSDGNTIHLLDAETGELRQRVHQNYGKVVDIALNPAGTLLAAGNTDGSVQLWDTATAERIMSLAPEPEGGDPLNLGLLPSVYDILFEPDGETLVVVSGMNVDDMFDGRTVRYWDITTETVIHRRDVEDIEGARIIQDREGAAHLIAWQEDMLSVRDAASGQRVTSLEAIVDDITYYSMSVSSHWPRLAVAASPGVLVVWDAETGTVIQNGSRPAGWVFGLAFNQDGSTLAVNLGGNFAQLWYLPKKQVLDIREDVSLGLVLAMAYSPAGDLLTLGTLYGEISVWDVSQAGLLAAPGVNVGPLTQPVKIGGTNAHAAMVTQLAFSPDGTRLFSAGASPDRTLRVWNMTTGQREREITVTDNVVRSVAVSPNGSLVATIGEGAVFLWDVDSGELVKRTAVEDFIGMNTMFSPDGSRLVMTGVLPDLSTGSVRVWDITSDGELTVLWEGETSLPPVADLSPDGSILFVTLASDVSDRHGIVLDPVTGHVLTTLDIQGIAPAFSPDGTLLAAGHPDGTVRLYAVASQ